MVKRNHFLFFALLSFINVFFSAFYVPYCVGDLNNSFIWYILGEVFGFISIALLLIGAFVLFIKDKALVLHIGAGLSAVTSIFNLWVLCRVFVYGLCGIILSVVLCVAYFIGLSKFNAHLPSNKKSFLLFTLTLVICSLCSRLDVFYWGDGDFLSSFEILSYYWQLPIIILWIISLFLGNQHFFGWYCDGVAGLAGVLCIAKNLSQIGSYSDDISLIIMIIRLAIVVVAMCLYYILRYKFKNLLSETPIAVQANKEKNSEDTVANYKKIAKLYQLVESGILTEAEFENEKQKILGNRSKEEESNVF